MITVKQIRAARMLLAWKQADLANAAKVSLATLNNIERQVTDPRMSTLTAIKQALEAAGVEFLSENGGGAGVRLKKP